MLMYIQDKLRDSEDVLKRFLLGGTIMAFFFMLRASEYCAVSGETVVDSDKIIRRRDKT